MIDPFAPVPFPPMRAQWDRADLPAFQRRRFWVEDDGPRFVYKYRAVPAADNAAAARIFESIVLKHRLWLAAPSTFSDIFDCHAHHRITLGGPALREALLGYAKRQWKMSAADIRKWPLKWPLTDLVVKPSLIEDIFAELHRKLRDEIGICSMAMTARENALWDEYADGHRGVSFQFAPWLDTLALTGFEVVYSDDPPVILNWLEEATDRDQILTLMRRKATAYQREREWRLFTPGRVNREMQFRPEALTGVFLGARIDPVRKDWVMELLARRAAATGMQPKIYQAAIDAGKRRLRFKGVPHP